MIPGLKAMPAFNAGGGVSGLTMSFVASTIINSANVTIPAAAIAGDYAILFDAAQDPAGSSISTVTPTGWTTIKNDTITSGKSLRAMVSHRILTGGGVVTGLNSSGEKKILLVFRPNVSVGLPTPSSWNGEATAGNPTSQAVSASGVATPLIVFAFAAATAGTAPTFSTETPAMTNVIMSGSSLGIRVGYTLYNSSPSDQSIDMNDVDINSLQSGYVRFG